MGVGLTEIHDEATRIEPVNIHLALRRSHARRLVLKLLIETPGAYPAMIARRTGLDVPATLGALRGLGQRYARQQSLVGLGLVRETPSGSRVRMYEATPRGVNSWARYCELATRTH
jgi:predicted transcriptional regulator with HTH domain